VSELNDNDRSKKEHMNATDRVTVLIGAGLAMAVIALAAYVVVLLGTTNPWLIAAVLTALSAVLGAIPPIIRAVRGVDR
jgi:hypothetical protein